MDPLLPVFSPLADPYAFTELSAAELLSNLVLVLIAGWSLFSGATWARVVGITLALISAIANFASIPYYPFWSILIIVLDVLVIWALAVYGGELAEGQR